MTTRRRTWLWVAAALAVIVAVSAVGAYLTTPRPGGRMDPNATGPEGTHALVTLLRHRGVEVVPAATVDDVALQARPDTLVLVAQTPRITGSELMNQLADLPGDLLLVAPDALARKALAPGIRSGPARAYTHQPDCSLREAQQAGAVDLRTTATYVANKDHSLVSCYDGALVRYRDGKRTVTVIGSETFMTNADLAREGNAALAMNLAGTSDRLIWYAPQHVQGAKSGKAAIAGLIPPNMRWLFWQLCVALALAAVWKSRRLGPGHRTITRGRPRIRDRRRARPALPLASGPRSSSRRPAHRGSAPTGSAPGIGPGTRTARVGRGSVDAHWGAPGMVVALTVRSSS